MSIKLDFFGGANEVGASNTMVRIGGKKLLIDAGIRQAQGQKKLPDFPDFSESGLPDAVLITHAHTDHIGALPRLRDLWQSGIKVYWTSATRDITLAMLDLSLNLMQEEEQEKKIPPLYSKDDLDIFKNCRSEEVEWLKPIQVCEGVEATWIPAGHILGAAMIYIKSQDESILLTGDVSYSNQLTIPKMKIPSLIEPDVMVMESTYGGRQHKDRKEQEASLLLDVTRIIDSGGKVLFPAFAIGRSQEVILILKNAMEKGAMEEGRIPKFPVYVDGMVNRINEIYSKYPDELTPSLQRKAKRGENLFCADMIQKVSSDQERESIINGGPCYIVASSGMLIGGRSLDYAKDLAKDSKNLIAITGYQAEGTNGSKLEDCMKAGRPSDRQWRLKDGPEIDVKADVKRYSLSAHADCKQLMQLVAKVESSKLYLVHGNGKAREKLSKSIQEKFPGIDVVLPENGKTYIVEKREGIAEGRNLSHDRILQEVAVFCAKIRQKGPFCIPVLAEMWFGTEGITPLTIKFFEWCLSLDGRFFERESGQYHLRESV